MNHMNYNDHDMDLVPFHTALATYHASLNRRNRETRKVLLDPSAHIVRISPNQRSHMVSLLRTIEKLIKRYPLLARPSWKVLFFHERFEIENNYPHTISDVVLLPYPMFFNAYNLAKQLNVLLHERIHVIQRRHPSVMRLVSTQHYGLRRLGTRAQYPDPDELQNPDTDEYVYADQDGRLPTQSLIAPSAPRHPMDHTYVPVHKMHPYERMAYELANQLLYTRTDAPNPFDSYLKDPR